MNAKLANACSQEEIYHSKFLILLQPHILPQLVHMSTCDWIISLTHGSTTST